MTWSPTSPDPAPDRRRLRRWWVVVGGLVAVLLVIGAAGVYAATRTAEDRGSAADGPTERSTPPSIPSGSLSTTPPANPGLAICREVQHILDEIVLGERDYVVSRRGIADQLRELTGPTPTHQAALDELADEFEAAAQMVEDDPTAESEARERDGAAQYAFIEAGGCDPA